MPSDLPIFAQNVGAGYLAVGRPKEAAEQFAVAFSYREVPGMEPYMASPFTLDLACGLAGQDTPPEVKAFSPMKWWTADYVALWKAWNGSIPWDQAAAAFKPDERWMAAVYHGWFLLKEHREAEAKQVLEPVLAQPHVAYDEWVITRALWEQHPAWGPVPGKRA